MTRDKKILYALATTVTAGLLPILLFAKPSGGRMLAAAWLALMAVAVCLLIKRRKAPSLHRKAALLLTVVFVLLYFSVFFMAGMHFGFQKTTVPFNLRTLLTRILPILLIIAASETIRRILLSQESRFASVFAFLLCLFGELAIAGGFQHITYFNALMDMVGLALFPAITSGILCQFVSARHGPLPPIAYRALFVLIPYIIPFSPALPDALVAFSTLLLPLLLLLFLHALYEKRRKRATASPHTKRLGIISAAIGLVLATGLMMLISCQFRFGTIVIATGSMTGELNVGDAIIYERYGGQAISEGQIVVFQKNQSLTVHRVVEIEHINGQTRYYTKGDANEDRDVGFITSNDIVGITDFKISYIGYPSIWMHRIFENGS